MQRPPTVRSSRETKPSFEETYPHYPFAELVRLAIAFGRWLMLRGGRARQAPVSRRALREVAKITMGRLPY